MTSVVYWVLLGLVIERPSYGLELYTRYERLYADLLPLSGSSHIYTALDELERRGFIETVPEAAGGRQPKPHYRATPVGASSFEDWYVAQMELQRRSLELWARQMGIFAPDPEAALRVIGRFRRESLATAGQIGAGPASVIDSRDAFIDEIVAEQMRIASGGLLSWLGFVAGRFKDRVGSGTDDGPDRT